MSMFLTAYIRDLEKSSHNRSQLQRASRIVSFLNQCLKHLPDSINGQRRRLIFLIPNSYTEISGSSFRSIVEVDPRYKKSLLISCMSQRKRYEISAIQSQKIAVPRDVTFDEASVISYVAKFSAKKKLTKHVGDPEGIRKKCWKTTKI